MSIRADGKTASRSERDQGSISERLGKPKVEFERDQERLSVLKPFHWG